MSPGAGAGFNGVEERGGRRRKILFEAGGAGGIEDIDQETSGVEIDAAVVLVLSLIHANLMDYLATGRPDRVAWSVKDACHRKDHAWGRGDPRPQFTWRPVRPIANEAMRCIQALQQTAGAFLVILSLDSLAPPVPLYLGVRSLKAVILRPGALDTFSCQPTAQARCALFPFEAQHGVFRGFALLALRAGTMSHSRPREV